MSRMTTPRCWFLCLVVACGGGARPSTPAAPQGSPGAEEGASGAERSAGGATADHVAPPFTADQLRAGIPVGTEMRFRVESAGAPALVQHWVFTDADESGCTIASRVLAEDGTLIEDEGSGTSTWAELETHAHFPTAITTRSESSVEVPGGRFETWLFEVRPTEPDAPVRRYHFARELPGPPVWMEVTRGGELVTRMVLLSREQP